MQWFKHWSGLRHKESMQYIRQVGGLEALGVAYKMLEIGAAQITRENDFSTTVKIDPSQKEIWATDLLGIIEDESGNERRATAEDLEPYLVLFEKAKFIERLKEEVSAGEWKGVKKSYWLEIITFLVLEGNRDEYTEKAARKIEQKAARRRGPSDDAKRIALIKRAVSR